MRLWKVMNLRSSPTVVDVLRSARVRITLLRPLVDQLGEVTHIRERIAVDRGQRRPRRLDIVDEDEIPALALVVRDTAAREGLERAPEPPAAQACILGHTSLLSAI